MKKTLLSSFLVLLLASCGSGEKKQDPAADQRFDAYSASFVEQLWKMFPGWASSVGYHKYDSILVIPDAAYRARTVAFCQAHLDSLKGFDKEALSDNKKTDYEMIKDQLESIIWGNNDMRSFEWNPSEYNVSGSFAEMLNNDYDSLDTRLRNFYLKMANIPAFYEAAKTNLKHPTLEHTQLAIEQNQGGMSVFEKDFPAALDKSSIPADEKTAMKERASQAVHAIQGYVDFLKTMKNDQPRSFRLGRDLYAKKFEYDIQSHYTIDEIFKKAKEHKEELHAKMAELADRLWPKYFGTRPKPADKLVMIRAMIDTLSVNHVQADSFQSAIEHQLPVLVEFIRKKNLIYIDPAKPLVVRREPDYMAGVAGASISAPGPYDKNGNTYYNVGSLSGWDAARAESYLREYNHYILQILNIHEAIPGHYTQLVYSNQSPSLIKSLFGSSSMVEGWAVYAERMMLENGYGAETANADSSSPEMWLMYYKWNLRSTCNTILDYSVHAGNMQKEEAIHFLTTEAFQQQSEAENKWRRVSVTQVQLCCYFTGYSEIYEFREELKKKMGDKFDLKQFHEKFLSYGSAPVKYIRQLMLAEMDKK